MKRNHIKRGLSLLLALFMLWAAQTIAFAEVQEFRYDNGTSKSEVPRAGKNPVQGVVFSTPAVLASMSWFSGSKAETVELFVFALDQDGKPTNHILFSGVYANPVERQWNTYTFETPVEAPDGFMVALGVSRDGVCWVTGDDGTDFQPGVRYYNNDYTSQSFGQTNDSSRYNYLIRATSVDMESVPVTAETAVPVPSYTVTIPETVDFGKLTKSSGILQDPFNVEVSDATWLFANHKKLTVTVESANDFALTHEGDGAITLPYTCLLDGQPLPENGEVLSLTGTAEADEALSAAVSGTFGLDAAGLHKAGSYRDLLTFSIFLEEVTTE